jgi:hypothetical protein
MHTHGTFVKSLFTFKLYATTNLSGFTAVVQTQSATPNTWRPHRIALIPLSA